MITYLKRIHLYANDILLLDKGEVNTPPFFFALIALDPFYVLYTELGAISERTLLFTLWTPSSVNVA